MSITFKQFITEDDFEDPDQRDDWIGNVQTYCSEFLNRNESAMKDDNKFLYRGMNIDNDLIGPIVPRADRMPMSTPVKRHKIMDEWFLRKFGFRYRSGGVFTHMKWDSARSYGATYVIFPEDGYTMCTSPIIHDLYDEFEEPYDIVKAGYFKHGMGTSAGIDELRDFRIKSNVEFDEAEIENVLHFGKYHEFKKLNNFEKDYENEIMIKCKRYYGIYVSGTMHTKTDSFQKLLYELV